MEAAITVALAGNPNAGKTTIFNAVTGARQHVGNWPGVTVEKKEGTRLHNGRTINVVDLPGTYSLTAFSMEEIVARNFVVEAVPDLVVDVVDAANLERNLYLTTQLMEMDARLVIALNMTDVAKGRGIHIDHVRLSELLGVPVVPTNGKKGTGIPELLDTILAEAGASRPPNHRRSVDYGTEVEEEVDKVIRGIELSGASLPGLSTRWIAIKLVEWDTDIVEKVRALENAGEVFQQVDRSRRHLQEIFDDSPDVILTDARYGFVTGAVKQSTVVDVTDRVNLSDNIDKVLTNRLLGPIILLVVLYTLYLFTFQGSDPLVKGFEAFFGFINERVSQVLPDGLLRSLIVSGIIDGVGGVLGFTPLIAFMFLAIAILEDTGYMARIAFMLDRVLRGFGLHGSSMLALMVSGGLAGGCAVPGIMATRTLKEPKERLVTILVAPLMNCGAKLPVYALLIGAFFSGRRASMMFLLTLISWAMALIAAKVIRSTVLAGPSAPFVLELPPYRMPTFKGLLIHTWERTWIYIKKAGTVILAISIVLWALMTFPGLPEDKEKDFAYREAALDAQFAAKPEVRPFITSKKDLEHFEDFFKREEIRYAKDGTKKGKDEHWELAAAIEYLRLAKIGRNPPSKGEPRPAEVAAQVYIEYLESKKSLENELQAAHLDHTVAGRVGGALEPVFAPLGFDNRTIIALVGGVAAKEVVVSTLGTAYSLGRVDTSDTEGLGERLAKEPGWNPLQAFTFIIFVMLYAPCFVTLVVIRRETGAWRWTIFAVCYTVALAYGSALVVRTVGTALGLGVG
ncbi:MAG: ferrous iron transport protein B [Pseudomonadota bacterium]